MTASISTVVTREATWFTSDPPTGTTSTQFPPLQAANGGYYDLVQGYFPKVIPRQRSLFITCEGIKDDELIELQANREVLYNMLITSYWNLQTGTGELEVEQQNHQNALDAVLTRVRGLLTDKTHGQQFLAVAAGGPEGDGRITVQMPSSYLQIVNGEPLIAEIRYTATDWIPGGS